MADIRICRDCGGQYNHGNSFLLADGLCYGCYEHERDEQQFRRENAADFDADTLRGETV